MIFEYHYILSQDFEDIKLGLVEPIEDNKIIVHALVLLNGDYVEKKFLFVGNDVKNYTDIMEKIYKSKHF